LRIAAAMAGWPVGRHGVAPRECRARAANAQSVIATPAMVGTQPTAAMIGGQVDEKRDRQDQQQDIADAPQRPLQSRRDRRETGAKPGAQRHRQQLGKEDLTPDMETAVTVKSAAKIQSRIATLAGTVTTGEHYDRQVQRRRERAVAAASSARRSATGAPGEMAISTIPTATGPLTANILSASTASAARDDDRRRTTAASTTRRCSAADLFSTSISPNANITANTVAVANKADPLKGD
jgi:hypothetical protein